MGWKDKVKQWGGGDFTFLSSDGECLIFVIVDDPILLEGKFKGKPNDRIGCPVVTDEGFQLFITGKRVFRKLSKFEHLFSSAAFMVVRHGGEGDINAKYDVTIVSDAAKVQQLFELAKREYKPDLLREAIEDAKKIMES